MKKFLIAIIGLFMSIFAFSQPAYAYFTIKDTPNDLDITFVYDSYYKESGETVLIYEITLDDPNDNSMVTMYFKNTIEQKYFDYYNFSSDNSTRFLITEFIPTYQDSINPDISNNTISLNLTDLDGDNDDVFYLHVFGASLNQFNAGSIIPGQYEPKIGIYDGNIQKFFASGIKTYADGLSEGEITGYADGYDDGENDLYTNGSIAQGLAPSGSYDVSYGYGLGQTDMYDNGSSLYGFVQSTSQDYMDGYSEGQEAGLSTHYADFMSGFEKWIVPAILIILILGGTLAMRRRREGE